MTEDQQPAGSSGETRQANAGALPHPSFAEALRFWLKLGFISFGGPTGQIAIMHTELVERRKWISESRFLHALNYCMLLPGPEAQQLATYAGWLLHRTPGAIVAGSLFVLPSAVLLWILSWVYVSFGKLSWMTAIFDGLKPAVMAIVAAAVIRIGRKALRNGIMWALAALAFVAIFFFDVAFPLIIGAAAACGLVGARVAPRLFAVAAPHAVAAAEDVIGSAPGASLGRAVRVAAVCLALWWLPVACIALLLGRDHAALHEGLFFSKAAMVTFGGAYAVLPYVAQQAVERYGWLSPGQMLDGLGLAETTPGPLIMVVQFVGFLGGWHAPGPLGPLAGATLGAAIATWVTFLPSFLWILVGAPWIEALRANARLTAALSCITAAVVGVVLNLAVWFAMHVILPAGGPVNWFAVIVAAAAFVALVRLKWGVIPVIVGAAVVGLVRAMVLVA